MENKNNQVEKPITMVIEETKQGLIDVINNSNLHPFILDSIMKELHNEIHISYLKQAQIEAENYNKNISKKDV